MRATAGLGRASILRLSENTTTVAAARGTRLSIARPRIPGQGKPGLNWDSGKADSSGCLRSPGSPTA